MNVAIVIGRKGSVGFPGKNTTLVLGRPLAAYALLAAKGARHVDRVYLSTDDEALRAVGADYGTRLITRPPELATKEALGEDAYAHAYGVIAAEGRAEGWDIECVVLLMCNAPTITAATLDEGIEALRADPTLDSAVTVSRYNMWSPLRARKVNAEGLLDPFVPFEVFGDPATLNCDRDSQGDVWFADMGCSIVRPRCMERMHEGLLPQRWMGRRIHPLKQWGGLDVDYEWQLPQVEFWLKAHGVEPPEPGGNTGPERP